MNTYDAIYDNGTLRLPGPLPLPNSTPVRVTIDIPTTQSTAQTAESVDAVYAVLDRRRETGISDLAARIDELQP
jgi:hypothetical protein